MKSNRSKEQKRLPRNKQWPWLNKRLKKLPRRSWNNKSGRKKRSRGRLISKSSSKICLRSRERLKKRRRSSSRRKLRKDKLKRMQGRRRRRKRRKKRRRRESKRKKSNRPLKLRSRGKKKLKP